MREFELLGVGEEAPSNPLLLERLRSCCLVMDALGPKVCGTAEAVAAPLSTLETWYSAAAGAPVQLLPGGRAGAGR